MTLGQELQNEEKFTEKWKDGSKYYHEYQKNSKGLARQNRNYLESAI